MIFHWDHGGKCSLSFIFTYSSLPAIENIHLSNNFPTGHQGQWMQRGALSLVSMWDVTSSLIILHPSAKLPLFL